MTNLDPRYPDTPKGRATFERHKKRRSAFLGKVSELHASGLSTGEIAQEIGKSHHFAESCLLDIGVTPNPSRRSATHLAIGKAKRYEFLTTVKELFEDGYSVNAISKKIGKSRQFVNCCLDDMGTKRPDYSEGNRRRAAKMSPEQRRANVANAIATIQHVGRNVVTQQEMSEQKFATGDYIGFGESEVAKRLTNIGINCIQQFPWEGYNIDIMAGNLAVEIHNATTRPDATLQRACRIVKLISCGYSVLYLWLGRNEVISDNAINEIVSFYNLVSTDPSPVGKYRVIRSNGEIDVTSARHLDDAAAVFSAYSALNPDGVNFSSR